jgi:hypothetical protein
MTALRSLSPLVAALAASLSLAASAQAYPPEPAHAALHHKVAKLRAEAPAPLFFLPRPQPAASPRHETDGLSRNPADCVRYGCIDNN